MKNISRIRILVAGLLLALFVSAMLPIAAFAEEGEPPAEPTPTAESTPETTPEPTSEESAPLEDLATSEVSASEETVATEEITTSASDDAVAEILAAIPEGTELILLDEQGESVSLASEEAAEMIAVIDPIWCPVGVAPNPLMGGCSANYVNLATLVASFVPTGNGIIWIEGGADSSAAPILISGAVAGNWEAANLFSLELRGGWDGISGSTVTNPLTPSTFTFRISITNWLANVTLSDISIDTSAGGNGLTVGTTKNIVLNRVTSSNNPGRGAFLNNTAGGSGTGTVTVNTGTFNNNATVGGLLVYSNSSITLNSVTANSNPTASGFGAWLDNTFGTGNVTISGTNTFNSNGTTGLTVLSNGSISLTGVTANSNSTRGADLDADGGTGTVTVSSSTFSSNVSTGGLLVNSKGSITLSSVTASSNTGVSNYGVALINLAGTGNITISGTSTFNSNGGEGGLQIDTNGAISLTGVTANLNADHGANLDNSTGTGTVTVKSSTFSSNTVGTFSSGGLKIYSKGSITLTSVTANSNLTANGNGAHLENTAGTGSVTLSGTNTFSNNGAVGLIIYTNGSITLTGVTASTNTNGGASLDNDSGTNSVTINSSTFNSNGGNTSLSVISHGTITLNSVKASDNTAGTGAELNNSSALTAKNVVLSGTNEFSNNWRWGLYISTIGSVTVNNVSANYNSQNGFSEDGIRIDAYLGTGAVTFTGTNITSGNDGIGLFVQSNGAIKLNNIIANSNGSYGVKIVNSTASTAQPVTFTGTSQLKFNFNDNLEISSKGLVSLANITANSSIGGSGINVTNTDGTAGITITGTNTANGNFNSGFYLLSKGPVSLNSLTANDNGNHGAYIVNSTAASFQKVSITGTNSFNDNGGAGLSIDTKGAISLNSVTASGNLTDYGAVLSNSAGGASANQPVTITGTNVFSNNDDTGLYISSFGNISISNVTANNNQGYGAYFHNWGADSPKSVTLSGTNQINGNYLTGLSIYTRGAITGNNITASQNGTGSVSGDGYGAYLHNCNNLIGACGSGYNSAVTLTGTNVFEGNYDTNLQIESDGAVTLKNVTASSSITEDGLYIDNRSNNSLAPLNVTISGTNVFSTNHCSGIQVYSYGVITLNSASAIVNGTVGCGSLDGFGIYLDNDGGSIPKGVTLSGTNDTEGNYTDGLDIVSLGAIKVNNLTARVNNIMGAYLANYDLDAVGGITLTGTNNLSNNGGTGLQVQSLGAISVNSVTADDNGSIYSGNGAALINYFVSAQKVTLTGTNSFSDNDEIGLWIQTAGAVSLSKITANGNLGGNGALIQNTFGSSSSPQAVTISGPNTFNDNYSHGLEVISYGAITLASTTAGGNGLGGVGSGADLRNVGSDLPQKVALTGTNIFEGNQSTGLYIQTKGAITSATKLTANDNGDAGAFLVNDVIDALGGVTLSGSNSFSNNWFNGLSVFSNGAITVNNLLAENNGVSSALGFGADLDNCAEVAFACTVLTPVNVTLSGSVRVNSNFSGGVYVGSSGAISLVNVTADANGGSGLELENITEGKGVTLSGTTLVTNSSAHGVYIHSLGPVTVNSLTSNGNGVGGLLIENQAAAGAQAVNITGTNHFENNTSYGFFVTSKGAVTLNTVYASYNTGYGAYLNNSYGSSNVILSGKNTFSENGAWGIIIVSTGSVSISNIAADGNGADGLTVSNASAVTINCGRFTDNTGDGIEIVSSASVTLKGVVSAGNGGSDLNYGGTPIIVRTC